MPRIDDLIAEFRAKIIKLYDEAVFEREKAIAVAICTARGGDPNTIVMGGKGYVLERARGEGAVIRSPIAPAWVDYLPEARCAIEALEEFDAKNRS